MNFRNYGIAPISPLFNLLDNFDLAIAFSSQTVSKFLKNIPVTFPEFNSGVICYRIDKTIQFFKQWLDNYRCQDRVSIKNDYKDEPSFRKTLFQSNIHFTVLRPEWNYYIHFPHIVNEKVKILHGKGALENIEKEINKNNSIRFFNAF